MTALCKLPAACRATPLPSMALSLCARVGSWQLGRLALLTRCASWQAHLARIGLADELVPALVGGQPAGPALGRLQEEREVVLQLLVGGRRVCLERESHPVHALRG